MCVVWLRLSRQKFGHILTTCRYEITVDGWRPTFRKRAEPRPQRNSMEVRMPRCTSLLNGRECGRELRLVTLQSTAVYICPEGHSMDANPPDRVIGVTVYRRSRNNGETWHVCSNCSSWPMIEFADQTNVPRTGTMCNECQALRRAGTCS